MAKDIARIRRTLTSVYTKRLIRAIQSEQRHGRTHPYAVTARELANIAEAKLREAFQ